MRWQVRVSCWYHRCQIVDGKYLAKHVVVFILNRFVFDFRSVVSVNSDIPTVQPTRCTCYLKLFIFVKRSTCFRRSFRPLSGAQNCVYSNGICQTAAATCCYQGWDETSWSLISSLIAAVNSSCFIYTVAVYSVLSSWWWTKRSKHVERFTRMNSLR
jgi:hypothetical protein